MYSSTTMSDILNLYDRAGALLAQEELSESDQAEFADIRQRLDRLWDRRRAELTFDASGPPRIVGGGTVADQQRQFAHGIAPLPGGAS